jgi:DNA-directed RNA polymerase subunit F
LIDRKYDHGLSPSEQAELALLQNAMYRHIDKVAPLPLDAARSLHQELLEKASRTEGTKNG